MTFNDLAVGDYFEAYGNRWVKVANCHAGLVGGGMHRQPTIFFAQDTVRKV